MEGTLHRSTVVGTPGGGSLGSCANSFEGGVTLSSKKILVWVVLFLC
jgi:hypothetical protein